MTKTTKNCRVLILGSGPAGYSAAIYAARAQLHPVIYEGSVTAGGALMNTTEVENFPGFESIDGFELMDRMKEQAKKNGCEAKSYEVVKLEKHSNYFTVEDHEHNNYKSKSIILAMGVGTQALATDCNTDCGAKARFTYPCPTLRNPGRKCTGKNPVIYGACEVERAVACDNFLTQELFDKAKSLLSKNFNATVWSQSNPDVYMAECYIAAESIITLIGAEVGGPYGAAIAGGAGLFVAHRLCEQSTKW